jgi:hypothetical protein
MAETVAAAAFIFQGSKIRRELGRRGDDRYSRDELKRWTFG